MAALVLFLPALAPALSLQWKLNDSSGFRDFGARRPRPRAGSSKEGDTMSRAVSHRVAASVTVTWLMFAGAPAHANVAYVYTGNPMAQISQNPMPVDGLTLEIQLAEALAPNFSGDISAEVYAKGWSFSGPDLTMFPGDPFASPPSVTVSTDEEGNIASWDVSESSLELGFGSPVVLETCFQPTAASCRRIFTGDSVTAADSATTELTMLYHYYNEGSPGTWTFVPEPSTLVLVGPPLVLLGAAARKRRPRW